MESGNLWNSGLDKTASAAIIFGTELRRSYDPVLRTSKRNEGTKVMKNRTAVFTSAVLFALLSTGVCFAQEQSNKVIPNSVWVGADGKFESEPDTALVQFGISAQQEKLPDATQQATQATEHVRQLLGLPKFTWIRASFYKLYL